MALFEIGPEFRSDLERHRPYFSVQLEHDPPQPQQNSRELKTHEQLNYEAKPIDFDYLSNDPAAKTIVDRIKNYTSREVLEPGMLWLDKECTQNLGTLRRNLIARWQHNELDKEDVAPQVAELLRQQFGHDIVRRLLHSNPDDEVGDDVLLRALNSLITRPGLLIGDNFPCDKDNIASLLEVEISDKETMSATRVGVASILAHPEDSKDPGIWLSFKSENAEKLAIDFVKKINSTLEPDLNGRLLLFVNRVLLRIALPNYVNTIQPKGPVTDLFVFSHGWHRYFYQGVAAYDRLISRFSRLLHRGVLETPPPFNPLLMCVHWHSDPGMDVWIDEAGRRDKLSFMSLVESTFERPSADLESQVDPVHRFTSVFEQCFSYFSRMCAADTSFDAANASNTTPQNKRDRVELAASLDRFRLRDAPGAMEHDKVAAAWTCYHESLVKAKLTDQTMRPARAMTGGETVTVFCKYFLGIFTVGGVIAYLLNSTLAKNLLDWFKNGFNKLHDSFLRWLANDAGLNKGKGHLENDNPIRHAIGTFVSRNPFIEKLYSECCWLPLFLCLLIVLAAIGVAYLTIVGARAGSHQKNRKATVPYFTLLMWLPVQILFSIPALIGIVATFFATFGKDKTQPKGIFAERLGKRNLEIEDSNELCANQLRIKFWRRGAARIARWPIQKYKDTLDRTNPSYSLLSPIESQLVFFEMQIRGTVAGCTLGKFLHRIVDELSKDGPKVMDASNVRIHLVGHSFGGLVVMNAARHLALDTACKNGDGMHAVESITLLEAAINSNWLEKEQKVLGNIKGLVGCVYSAYDTANGFLFPVANGGRLAAGFVGLSNTPEPPGNFSYRIPRLVDNDYNKFDTRPAERGLFALLVSPPRLYDLIETCPGIANLDASRLIYAGSVATGGGHDDIFKDDVVNLAWAVTQARLVPWSPFRHGPPPLPSPTLVHPNLQSERP